MKGYYDKEGNVVMVESITTLSDYRGGRHVIDGRPPEEEVSIKDSLALLRKMLEEFKDYPTGTKLRLVIEHVFEDTKEGDRLDLRIVEHR